MKFAGKLLLMTGMTLCLAGVLLAGEPMEIPLWPPAAPPSLGVTNQEGVVERGKGKPDRSIHDVTVPTLTVYLPPGDQTNRQAVVICPGGGYANLAIDKEGHDVARWLNTLGVVGIVLKYRMPRPDLTADQKPWPIQDGERAIRLVRSRAAEWKIDPKRVGIMGFSAGGHLASAVGTHFTLGNPLSSVDPLDGFSSRPDFMVLIYPVITMKEPITHEGSLHNLLGKTPDEKMVALYSNELQVTPQTPPTFLAQAMDDRVSVENSERFHAALQKAGVPSEIHLFEKGGHGYGLGINGGEPAAWPGLCATWLKAR